MIIRTIATKLDDGSEVYDVRLIDGDDDFVELNPCSDLDAVALVEGLVRLIREHTNNTVCAL